MTETDFDVVQAAETAWAVFAEAFESTASITALIETLAQEALRKRQTLRSSDFDALKPHLLKELANLPETVIGVCFTFAVDVLEDVKYFMPALERDGSSVYDGTHDLDPESDTFYDYSLLDWLTPSSREKPYAHGPYIDLGGTNKFTITTSSPVHTEDRFLGVVGVDVALESYERSLVQTLDHAPGSFSVLNAEKRVVVSNDAGRAIGTLLSVDDTELIPCGPYGWSVLHLP